MATRRNPFCSKRLMISPTRPRCTPSGLMAMNVRSWWAMACGRQVGSGPGGRADTGPRPPSPRPAPPPHPHPAGAPGPPSAPRGHRPPAAPAPREGIRRRARGGGGCGRLARSWGGARGGGGVSTPSASPGSWLRGGRRDVERAAGPGADREEGRATATPRTPRRPTREADAARDLCPRPGPARGRWGLGSRKWLPLPGAGGARGWDSARAARSPPAPPPAPRAHARAHSRCPCAQALQPDTDPDQTPDALTRSDLPRPHPAPRPWVAPSFAAGEAASPSSRPVRTPVQPCLSPEMVGGLVSVPPRNLTRALPATARTAGTCRVDRGLRRPPC